MEATSSLTKKVRVERRQAADGGWDKPVIDERADKSLWGRDAASAAGLNEHTGRHDAP